MSHIISNLEFKQLGYQYNSLEPFIDAQTMELHHSKHHQAYYNNMIKWVSENGHGDQSLEALFGKMSEYPDFLRNNSGGHYNHELFWSILKLNSGSEPVGNLADAIRNTFGTYAAFRDEFSKAAVSRFGSGWAWLIIDTEGKLAVTSTPNQDNPLMDLAPKHGKPIIGLDVWEHAYYLKYQNRRPEYIDAFWSVINWAEAEKRFNMA